MVGAVLGRTVHKQGDPKVIAKIVTHLDEKASEPAPGTHRVRVVPGPLVQSMDWMASVIPAA